MNVDFIQPAIHPSGPRGVFVAFHPMGNDKGYLLSFSPLPLPLMFVLSSSPHTIEINFLTKGNSFFVFFLINDLFWMKLKTNLTRFEFTAEERKTSEDGNDTRQCNY